MSSITMKNKKGTVIHRTTSETLRLGDDISTNHNQVRVSVQSINRKKSQTTSPSCSFQITGVSLTRYDLGDDSADDLDESHTDDISRVTDNETPSFSEDSRDTDEPQQFIYNVATSVPNQNQSKVENDPKIIENENRNSSIGRFKVVKIESVVPFSRGRWTCFDYLDQTDGSIKPSYIFCTRSQFGSDQSQLGEDGKSRTCIEASFLDNNETGDKKRVSNNSAFFEANCQEPYLCSGAIIMPEGAPLFPAPLNRPPRNKARTSCPTTPNFLPMCTPIRSTRPFLTTSSSFYPVIATVDDQSGVITNDPAKTIMKIEPTELVQQDSNKNARYLATGCSFKSISFSFRVGASTVGDIIRETVEIIWQELQPQYMPQPTKNRFKAISRDFYKIWNFPNVIGTIDGKHVRILCPKKSGSMFFNYKKYFSVVLQGVVDANYQFIAIDVGGYGKQSDGGTFQASDFYKRLIRKEIHVPEPAFLPGTNVKVPYVFLADEAYPLLNFLLKPYRGQNITIDQETFNNRLSRARKPFECAFGILCAKWRLLSKAIETDVNTADNIIRCVCILHNLILKREGFERHLTDVEIIRNNHQGLVGRPSTSAVAVRDLFKTFIIDNPLVYT